MKKLLIVLCLALATPALAVVSSTSSRSSQTGDGAAKVFAFTFPVTTSASHVEVYLGGSKQSSGYTVALNANQTSSPGGTVTFVTAPANTMAVRIQRTVPLTQDTVYSAYSAFPAKTTEKALDRSVYQSQQVDRQITDEGVTRAAKDVAHEAALALGAVGGNATYITATGSTTARTLAARAADAVNVMDYGAVGDGVADDTAALVAAIGQVSIAAPGQKIHFPDGTYLIDTITTSKSFTLDLAGGAVLKHKTASADHMINFTGSRLLVTGGAIDGNRVGQGAATRYTINADIPAGVRVEVRGVAFTGTKTAGVAAFNFGGHLSVEHCRFEDMAEHDGVPQHSTMAAYIGSGQLGAKGLARFNHNTLIGTVTPALPGGSPGGIFFAPTTDYLAGEGNFSTLEAIGNYFWGIGQNCSVNDIAAIHTYPTTHGLRAIGNYFEQSGFAAIAAKSVTDAVIQNNVIMNGQTSTQMIANVGAIYYTPGDHSASYSRPRAVISGNIIDTPGAETGVGKQDGIAIIGTATSLATDVVVSGNVINGAGRAIHADYATSLSFHGNDITGGTGGTANTEDGVELDHVYGTAKIAGNTIRVTNGYGIFALQGIDTATVVVENNTVYHTTAGSYAVLVRGAAVAKFSGNYIDSTTSAISVTTDGTNPVGLLIWDLSNHIKSGTVGFVFASITRVAGHIAYANHPDGLVTALAGTLYTRTSGGAPALYIKESGAGNTGWRPFETTTVSGDRGNTSPTLTATTDFPTQRWTTALTADRTITLSAAGAANGDRFRIVRLGGDVAGPWNLIVGALKNLPAATWCEVEFDGTAWILTGYGAL